METAREVWKTVCAVVLLVSLGAIPAQAASCIRAEPLFALETADGIPLRQPADLAVKGDRIFVLDDLNGRVAVFSLRGSFLFSIKLPGGSGSAYLGFDVGSDDNLYLASSGGGKIVVLTQKGKELKAISTGGGKKPTEPVAVEVSKGQIFVVDNEAHSIKVFDMDGKEGPTWGGSGEGPAKFRYPFRVVQDASGRVIVTDTLNSRVQIFTPAGELLAQFGEFGVVEGTLYRPAGLGLWDDDFLLVSDNYLGSIQVFDRQGGYEASICGADGKPALFDNPVSLEARKSTLYVLEMGANRVQALRLPGKR